MNKILLEKVVVAYEVLQSINSEHELLKYFYIEENSIYPRNSKMGIEFRERFGLSIDIKKWRGKSLQGYADYLSTITLRKYLGALERAIKE